MFETFKQGDCIFFTNAGDSMMVEHICKVEEYENGIVKTNKLMSVIKQPGPKNTMNLVEVPSMGIISTFNRAKKTKDGYVYINLNKFDMCGYVQDEELKNRLTMVGTGLILDDINKDKINAVLGNQQQPQQSEQPMFSLVK